MTRAIVAPRAVGHSRAISSLAALAPAWLLALTALTSEAFPMVFSAVPSVETLPLGLVLESIALAWMVGGLVTVWRARSPLAEAIGLAAFTIPATTLAVLTPALIEVLQSRS
jgi:hypothetical protein